MYILADMKNSNPRDTLTTLWKLPLREKIVPIKGSKSSY